MTLVTWKTTACFFSNSILKHHLTVFYAPLQHWIRLELFPDVLVHRLKMTVDPADSSYMPSLVVVSGGLKLFVQFTSMHFLLVWVAIYALALQNTQKIAVY